MCRKDIAWYYLFKIKFLFAFYLKLTFVYIWDAELNWKTGRHISIFLNLSQNWAEANALIKFLEPYLLWLNLYLLAFDSHMFKWNLLQGSIKLQKISVFHLIIFILLSAFDGWIILFLNFKKIYYFCVFNINIER